MVTYYLLKMGDLALFSEYAILEGHNGKFEIVRDTYCSFDGSVARIQSKSVGKAATVADAAKLIEKDCKQFRKPAKRAEKELARIQELMNS